MCSVGLSTQTMDEQVAPPFIYRLTGHYLLLRKIIAQFTGNLIPVISDTNNKENS